MMPKKRIIKRPWAWKGKEVCFQVYGHLGLREPEFYETDEGRKFRNVKLPGIDLTPVEIWIRVLSKSFRDQVWDLTWVEYLTNCIDADIIVCPDTRFPIEIERCTYTIKCTNPRIPNRQGESVDDVLAQFRNWNFLVSNDGTKDHLNDKAYRLAEEIAFNLRAGHSAAELLSQGPSRF